MKLSHPHPNIGSNSGQSERGKSLSTGGQKLSSASYEALSPLGFTSLCGEIQDYQSELEE